MGLLDGKVAVITGAGSGMAKASVKVFVREGANVVAGDITGAENDTATLPLTPSRIVALLDADLA